MVLGFSMCSLGFVSGLCRLLRPIGGQVHCILGFGRHMIQVLGVRRIGAQDHPQPPQFFRELGPKDFLHKDNCI